MKLNTLSIENFMKELKERKRLEVRIALNRMTTYSSDGDRQIPFVSVFVKLTAIDKDMIIYYQELVGRDISYFDDKIEEISGKAKKRAEEIKKILRKKNFKVKEGVYEE